MENDNMQAPVEMPPLGDAPTQVLLQSGNDVETTQDQGVRNEIQAQEDVQTYTTAVELVDIQCSVVLPTE